MMTFRTALLAAGVAAMPLAAGAQPITGPYVSLGGGLSVTPNTSKIFGYAPPIDVGAVDYPVTLKDGYVFSGAVGYGLGNGFRVEIEGAYRNNALRTFIATPNVFAYKGDEQVITGIVSAIYDFNLGLPIYPYVGGGVGIGVNRESNAAATKKGLNIGFPVLYDATDTSNGTDTSLAFQIQGGISFPISAIPGLSLTADYKWLTMPNHRSFSRNLVLSPEGAGYPTLSGSGYATFSGENNHSFMVGVRYAFGAPAAAAPAPAPVAAAVPPSPVTRSFLVFFDWDKAVLTDRAKQIVGEAAAASTKVQVTKIEVNGYTDTSGTPTYNKGLSVARAKAVMAELVKDGVPASAIAIMGFGDTHLLVPTGAGVREPQNRRVEIILK